MIEKTLSHFTYILWKIWRNVLGQFLEHREGEEEFVKSLIQKARDCYRRGSGRWYKNEKWLTDADEWFEQGRKGGKCVRVKINKAPTKQFLLRWIRVVQMLKPLKSSIPWVLGMLDRPLEEIESYGSSVFSKSLKESVYLGFWVVYIDPLKSLYSLVSRSF